MKGIDVSENNGYIDWDAVKNAGIDFAMVRCSYGKSGRDELFQHNVNEAVARGIKCGAYHYGYGLTVADAAREASNCLDAISNSGVLLELPVFYDMEDADGYKGRNGFVFSRENITSVCRSFLSNFSLNKGIYASESWLNSYIDWQSLGCPVWNASWGNGMASSFSEANGNWDGIQAYMWQFTDKLNICGKLFDADIVYDDVDKAGQHGY